MMGQTFTKKTQNFELNLASVIDCLTVLITFMLASASFLSVGILDAGITAGGESSLNASPPPIVLTLELKKNSEIKLVVQGKLSKEINIKALSATDSVQKVKPDYSRLEKELQSMKAEWPGLDSATLTAENEILYQSIVATMDQVRKWIPNVMLGGF